MKVKMMLVVLIAALLVPFGAFASGDQEAEGGYTDSITLMASQNWIKDIDREIFAGFQEETGIEVKVIVTPDGGFDTLLGTTLSGGSNSIDMFMFGAGTYFISAGIPDVALDLSNEEWVSRYEPWAKEVSSYQGKVYGLNNWGIDYEGILYNKSFFEENGFEVPKTWDEFIALCDKIASLGVTPLYEGINGVWHTQSWINGMTPAVLEEKGDFVEWINAAPENKLTSIKALKSGAAQLEQLLGTMENGKPKYFTNDGQAEDWFGSYPALRNRDVVMMFTYSAYEKELIDQGSVDTWGMFPCPIGGSKSVVNNGGGICKFINKNSDNIEECKLFFNYLNRPENLDKYYAARSDLAAPAFQGVTTMTVANATKEAVENSEELPPTMMLRSMLHFSPDVYKYCQAVAAGSAEGLDIFRHMDEHRVTMFEATAE